MAYDIAGIHHIQLAAPEGSAAVARQFYGDIIGMPEIPKPEPLQKRGGVWFQCGTHQLHIAIQAEFVPHLVSTVGQRVPLHEQASLPQFHVDYLDD